MPSKLPTMPTYLDATFARFELLPFDCTRWACLDGLLIDMTHSILFPNGIRGYANRCSGTRQLLRTLAALHRDSVSPTGKFGFHTTTCYGPHPQNTAWEDSWAVFFARLLRQFFERKIKTNGPDVPYEALFAKFEKAIPGILEPLQSNGRFLKPCLIHGDLWEENTGTSVEEDAQPKMFDAAAFYGDNEYDLGMWRREICHFGQGKNLNTSSKTG